MLCLGEKRLVDIARAQTREGMAGDEAGPALGLNARIEFVMTL